MEPLVKSAELEIVLPGELGLPQAALIKKVEELLARLGRVSPSSDPFAFFHEANLAFPRARREDVLRLTLTI
jgi:hypothetical protein